MSDGVLNVLKPPGMTSHDVVACLRRIYRTKKVGHAGTLDPAAAGVLPVALGKATRLLEYMVASDKEYRAELSLGYATDTGDDVGQVIASKPIEAMPAEGEIIQVLNSFRGRISQVPPMYSAIKIDGKKLYELARAGVEVDRPARLVDIESIRLLQLTENGFSFVVGCSKGTYIRSLCEDIGTKLGYPATMSFLVRTRVGRFTAEQATTLEEIAAAPQQVLLPLDWGVQELPALELDEAQCRAFGWGQHPQVATDLPDETICRVYAAGAMIGIGRYRQCESRLVPEKVFPAGSSD